MLFNSCFIARDAVLLRWRLVVGIDYLDVKTKANGKMASIARVCRWAILSEIYRFVILSTIGVFMFLVC